MLTQRALATATLAVLGVLAGCESPAPVQAPNAPPRETESTVRAFEPPAGAVRYVLDPARSRLEARVYRAGPFARLGHNHVVTAVGATGEAWVGATPDASGFAIVVPVASLVVDDPAARAAAGPDFGGEVSSSAREGTYANMTRAEVLDLAGHPTITLRCDGLQGRWESPVAPVDVTLRGVTRRIDVPLEVSRSEGAVSASGEFRIRQSDFGITPFSVAGGAIQVADEVTLSFSVVAVLR
ncbi:MAG: YceI family protein [Steroidobacteraceae bacterium]